jgi:hypothetical protein
MLSVSLSQRSSLVTLLSALALLGPATIGIPSGVPTIFSPFPALTAIPVLMLAQWHLEYVALLIPALLFLSWNPQLFRGEGQIPKRSYVLFVLLVVLTAIDFAVSWKWGLKYQGPPFTAIVCSINIAWLGFLGLAFRRTFKAGTSFRTSLFLHWMLFAWLGWYAFPWLGELI